MSDDFTIEYKPLAELLQCLHPQNPKQHDISAIVTSYKEHGYVASGILDSRTNLFLAGHGRVEALAAMKRQKMSAPRGIRNGGDDWLVPVQVGYHSDNDVAALAYLAADNKITELGGWDEPALAELLQELANSDEIDISASGFDAEALDDLLRDLGQLDEPAEDPGAQIDKAAELNKKWGVVRGDIWQIGKHRIMCGDSTSAEDVALLMCGVKADAVVTDPPYGMNLDVSSSDLGRGDVNRVSQHKRNYKPIIGDDKNFDPCFIFEQWEAPEHFLWGADYYADKISCLNSGSWLVWDKRDGVEDMEFSLSSFELCWSKNKHRRDIIRKRWAGVLGMETQDTKTRQHPTQKPIEVITWILEKYCGDVIVDPFLGSGTTMVGCEQLGKTCYGLEISTDYCAVILQRMSDFGLSPVLVKKPSGENIELDMARTAESDEVI